MQPQLAYRLYYDKLAVFNLKSFSHFEYLQCMDTFVYGNNIDEIPYNNLLSMTQISVLQSIFHWIFFSTFIFSQVQHDIVLQVDVTEVFV